MKLRKPKNMWDGIIMEAMGFVILIVAVVTVLSLR